MGILDKLKNALFEVEYVEEEVPKKEKTRVREDESTLDENKPIAKKIVLPGKKEEKVEVIKEEDLEDEDFEIRPKDQALKTINDSFKFMDDEDFKVDEEPVIVAKVPEPEVEQEVVKPAPVEVAKEPEIVAPTPAPEPVVTKPSVFNNDYVKEYDSYRERVNVDDYKVTPKESKPYGMDSSYQVSIKKYGSYENKDEKTYFKPSPIISPIYGILDKNYKKEDVVPKKNVRISTYSRSNVNVDDVRNKAFAHEDAPIEVMDEVKPVENTNSFEVEEEDDNLLVDLSNEREKPEVKEITVGDAMEYFDDLGLEYNVDYVDVSNKRKKVPDLEDDIKKNMEEDSNEKDTFTPKEVVADRIEKLEDEPVEKIEKEVVEEKKEKPTPVVEVKDDGDCTQEEDDDNLFDLIDSMYKEG